ncbi:GNAT family N-acetyltransferase [Mesorhizobium sp. CGMCC 1.15528]|uniref:GNAT family N-acetyltransferase n=1 Tax=Mesorhizobium zhangyense TaxID=1776730 RepID=A0A7C9R4J5_9HYPH|nr:GNAT family N-acetyltransferase [Mesorhizobium zhangyense]NGN39980.1 GNAT family N-acetyltransferase [Mesorhizobium zhangyense]
MASQNRSKQLDNNNSEAGDYLLVVGTPDIKTYRRLRSIAGMSEKTVEAAALGLPNTIYAVTLIWNGETVGMGRIIGDGGCFYQITDIAVDPDHQGKGLGKKIIEALVGHLRATAPETAYVSLIADGPARHLYEKFGFEATAPASIGMALQL